MNVIRVTQCRVSTLHIGIFRCMYALSVYCITSSHFEPREIEKADVAAQIEVREGGGSWQTLMPRRFLMAMSSEKTWVSTTAYPI